MAAELIGSLDDLDRSATTAMQMLARPEVSKEDVASKMEALLSRYYRLTTAASNGK